ncbi:putative membrane protein [Synechococcus sp. A18-40]|nr:putative membrane protein [Synechococcus sp. A18-40]
MPAEFIGYAAAFLTTISFFPQAVKTLRSGDTRSISLGMYALFTSGVMLWSIYGVMAADGPVLIANLITLIPAAVVLQRKITAKHPSS